MQFFMILSLLLIVCIAAFAVQNSTAPAIVMKFLLWKMETSLIYLTFGSFVSGMLFMLFLWVPSAIKSFRRTRDLKKQVELLKKERELRIAGAPSTSTNKAASDSDR